MEQNIHLFPHDVDDEEPQDDLFHSQSFQHALVGATKIMSDVHAKLVHESSRGPFNPAIQYFREKAEKLTKFQCHEKKKIGLVGSSGAGKTSVLNCLLDIKDLMRLQDTHGVMCTAVATEFHYHEDENFIIEVHTFSQEELRLQIQELVRHFRQQDYFSDSSLGEQSARRAWDTLDAMFHGFSLTKDFLLEESEDTIVQRLIAWAEVAQPSGLPRPQLGLDLQRCSDILAQFSSHLTSQREQPIWPYVSHLIVHLKARILEEGLILVDLPDINDTNSTRRFITERYLRECTRVLATCNIEPAVLDSGVEQIMEFAANTNLLTVDIVCTHSEDVHAEDALNNWPNNNATETIRQVLNIIENHDERLDKMNRECQENMLDGELIYQRLNETMEEQKRWKFELKSLLITTKISLISQELQIKCQQTLPGYDPNVFCVSTVDYWSIREQPREVSTPFLNLSGILKLRKYCMAVLGDSLQRAAIEYIKIHIPVFFAEISLFLQASTRTAEALRNTEEKLKDIYASTNIFSRLSTDLKQHFRELFFHDQQVVAWSQIASHEARQWSAVGPTFDSRPSWHHSTFSAFCENYGRWKTKTVGPHDWNFEALAGVRLDIKNCWGDLLAVIERFRSDLKTTIKDITEMVANQLRNDWKDDGGFNEHLVWVLVTNQNSIINCLDRALDGLLSDLNILLIDITSGIRSSFIGQAMEPFYARAQQQYGPGSHSRRAKIIRTAFEDQNLFPDLIEKSRNRFNLHAEALDIEVQTKVLSHLNYLENSFQLIRKHGVHEELQVNSNIPSDVNHAIEHGTKELQRIVTLMDILVGRYDNQLA